MLSQLSYAPELLRCAHLSDVVYYT